MKCKRTIHVVALVGLFGLALAATGCDKPEGLRITDYGPKTGPYTGGDPVVFQGSGFATEGVQGAQVWFGSKEGRNVRFRGDEEMVVDAPGGDIGEVVDIVIKFDSAKTWKKEKAYTYVDPAAGFGVDELTQDQQ